MNIKKEVDKIEKIIISGKFIYKGVTYSVDQRATSQNPDNSQLKGRPLLKLTGVSEKDTVIVWSHDCTVVEDINTDITSDPQPEIVSTDTAPEKIEYVSTDTKVKPKRNKKK